eukprot:TRINITY_DN1561_c0_g1_i1.p2 TRINITY_DN1561_c0_g1~~TRINITY_DN1561_c0_g1_i1.p2  ORF type:complete len:339 (-),score=63.20 TRINITY_DN1561_c0_g1_i1:2876-3784(-)
MNFNSQQPRQKFLSPQVEQPFSALDRSEVGLSDDEEVGDTFVTPAAKRRFCEERGLPTQANEKVQAWSDNPKAKSEQTAKGCLEHEKASKIPYKDSELVKKTFEERMQYFKEKYKKNNDIVAMEYLAEEQIECTFAPQTQAKVKANRTVDQFWKDQQTFIKARKAKVQLIGQEEIMKEQKNFRRTPQINKKSTALSERKRSQSKDVHERLFTKCSDFVKVEEKENEIEIEKAQEEEANARQKKQKTDTYIKKKLSKELDEICDRVNKEEKEIESIEALCIYSRESKNYRRNTSKLWLCQERF